MPLADAQMEEITMAGLTWKRTSMRVYFPEFRNVFLFKTFLLLGPIFAEIRREEKERLEAIELEKKRERYAQYWESLA
jgi:hypothetical protein